MGQITTLARSLVRFGLSNKDVSKIIAEAKKGGVTAEEKAELQTLLTSSEFQAKFSASSRETLTKFLGQVQTVVPAPVNPTPPANVTPTTPAKPVSQLVPASLGQVTDAAALPAKFKTDVEALASELTGKAGLTDSDKANRVMEFFQAYASKFRSLTYNESDSKKKTIAEAFGKVLESTGFNSVVTADGDKDGVKAGVEILLGENPEAFTVKADHKPWTTTYWPMAGNNGDVNGSASSNLWATGGALDKFDQFLKAKGKPTGALSFERQSSLNWMLERSDIMKGKVRTADAQKTGHYIPDSSLSEKDAERTTGVDFNGNGKIDADVAWDFLDSHGQFGTDGKTEGSMSVGWWGSCDKVALAGNLFKEPKKDVTINGVTFTAQDIKGLLTVIADSQSPQNKWAGARYDGQYDLVRLKNGTSLQGVIETPFELYQPGMRRSEDRVEITSGFPAELTMRTASGETKTLKAAELASINREDKRDDAGLFHNTIRDWLKTGMPTVMDKDPGEHVWNYNFWKCEDKETTVKPSWAPEKLVGINGPAGDGKVTYVEREVELGGGGSKERYQYWVEEKNGKIVNSGWASGSTNPDFLWGPARQATFTGANERNPFVDPALVKEIYQKSIEE